MDAGAVMEADAARDGWGLTSEPSKEYRHSLAVPLLLAAWVTLV